MYLWLYLAEIASFIKMPYSINNVLISLEILFFMTTHFSARLIEYFSRQQKNCSVFAINAPLLRRFEPIWNKTEFVCVCVWLLFCVTLTYWSITFHSLHWILQMFEIHFVIHIHIYIQTASKWWLCNIRKGHNFIRCIVR